DLPTTEARWPNATAPGRPISASLFLDPPLVHVPVAVRAERARQNSPHPRVEGEDPVVGDPEHVGHVVVQDLVHLLVDALTRRLRAVGPVSPLVDQLVDGGVVVAVEVVSGLGGACDVA